MSTSIEAQGVTVDEAIQVALNQLGVSRDRVEIEILHHPRAGFLGIGARRAKVRATMRVGAFEDGAEYDMSTGMKVGRSRRRQPRRRRGGRGAGRGRGSEQAGGVQSAGGQADDAGAAKRAATPQAPSGGRQRDRRPGRQRRGGRGGRQDDRQGKRGAVAAADSRPGDSTGTASPQRAEREASAEGVGPPSVSPTVRADQDAVCERATKVITELITRMGFDASATTTLDARTREIFVRVRSQGEAHLVGRRGQTLDALEHILTRMLFPGEASSERQIVLDIGGYRDRRRDELLRLAPKLKAEAIARRCRVLVGPLNARDRKVLIGALTGDTTIDVQSEGTGFYRRVQIAPAGTRGENLPTDVMSDELADDADAGLADGADRQGVPD